MPLFLLLLVVLVPIFELYVIIQVGQAVGVWWTILLLVADSVLGTVLMRSQGRRAWLRFGEAMAVGRPPAKETLDGVLIIFGGAFLLTPGFLSDVLGFAFLLPPSRAVIRRVLLRQFTARLAASVRAGQFATGQRGGFPGFAGGFAPPRPGPGARRGDGDVEGTARDVEPPTLGPRGT